MFSWDVEGLAARVYEFSEGQGSSKGCGTIADTSIAPPIASALPQGCVMKGLVLGQGLCVFVDGRSDAIP